MLKLNGVNWDPNTQIQLMDFSVLYPTLFDKKIDTAEVGLAGSWEGAVTRAKAQGLTLNLKLLSDWGFKDYSKTLIVSNDTIKNEPELVAHMVNAFALSQREAYQLATGTLIFNILKSYDPQADENITGQIWDNLKKYVTKFGPFEDEVITYQIARLADAGTSTTLKSTDLYTNAYIPK